MPLELFVKDRRNIYDKLNKIWLCSIKF